MFFFVKKKGDLMREKRKEREKTAKKEQEKG